MFLIHTLGKRFDLIFRYAIEYASILANVNINLCSSFGYGSFWESPFGVVVLLSSALVLIASHIEGAPLREVENQRDQRSWPKLIIGLTREFTTPLMGTGLLIFFGPLILDSLGYSRFASFAGPVAAPVLGIMSYHHLYGYLIQQFERRISLLLTAFSLLAISQHIPGACSRS
ncbi:OLC1v1035443C1 [Oldenlandia corymbosa var. corymbosa]|uniref:OLC1v1035443C1 n=1 Tax=Oldenlandia corymbosa var. corymbosa TaxID=529605 RepID=A0AAV1CUW5_OLDCO|nr:OLC1v1035443C1 [Oldenlandia corymbosa var. corymbosa]